MIRKLLFSSLLALALVFVVACGGTPAASNDAGATSPAGTEAKPADSKPAVESNKPTEAAKPIEAAEPTAAPDTASGAESRDIQDLNGSLEALESYRLRFTFSFDGKDDQGKPQKGSMEFVQETIKASKDRHTRFTSTGDASQEGGKNGTFEMYQVGGTTYIYSPDGQADQKCIGMTSAQTGPNTSDIFKPSDILGGLKQAKLLAKGETVNGIVADHYTFDENSVTFGTFGSAKGDAWVAQDGGFMVKYIGTATGKDTIMGGKTSEGTFTWEYNLEDANQVASIAVPKECEGQKAAADIPVPENATDKTSFGKIITFKSPDAPADIAAFYKKELPGQGWTAGDANAMGDLQTLSFSKEGRTLSITITKEGQGGSSVLISEEKGA